MKRYWSQNCQTSPCNWTIWACSLTNTHTLTTSIFGAQGPQIAAVQQSYSPLKSQKTISEVKKKINMTNIQILPNVFSEWFGHWKIDPLVFERLS